MIPADTDPGVDDLKFDQVLAIAANGLDRNVGEDGLDLQRGQFLPNRLGEVHQDVAGMEAAEQEGVKAREVGRVQIPNMEIPAISADQSCIY